MKTFLGVKSDLKTAAKPAVLFRVSGSTSPDSSFSGEAQNPQIPAPGEYPAFTGNVSTLLYELSHTVKHYLTSCCLFKEERRGRAESCNFDDVLNGFNKLK